MAKKIVFGGEFINDRDEIAHWVREKAEENPSATRIMAGRGVRTSYSKSKQIYFDGSPRENIVAQVSAKYIKIHGLGEDSEYPFERALYNSGVVGVNARQVLPDLQQFHKKTHG